MTLPVTTGWYLSDLGEARKQDLFTHQSPQKLKVLREHALLESLGVVPEPSGRKRVLPLKEGNNKGNVHNFAFALTCFCFFAAE